MGSPTCMPPCTRPRVAMTAWVPPLPPSSAYCRGYFPSVWLELELVVDRVIIRGDFSVKVPSDVELFLFGLLLSPPEIQSQPPSASLIRWNKTFRARRALECANFDMRRPRRHVPVWPWPPLSETESFLAPFRSWNNLGHGRSCSCDPPTFVWSCIRPELPNPGAGMARELVDCYAVSVKIVTARDLAILKYLEKLATRGPGYSPPSWCA